ncbi:MAG: cytochrome C oxidase subunit IV family protein [Methylococcales bacterium]|nr:cytochrome C oxidase subunit IV family protein [Methylococcales bacterium]
MDNFTKNWLLLMLLTLFAFGLGWLKLLSLWSFALLLFTTFIKGHIIADYFMGLKEIKGKYRLIPTIWLFITLTLVALAYYVPIK